jgi:uncharacterized membrane protein
MNVALLIAALASGLIAGGFFAFSTFVMNALSKLPPAQGISAMQSINVVVVPSPFVVVLVATALGSLVLSVVTILRWGQPGAMYLLAACLLFFVGTFLVTVVFNVPLNNALATVDPTSTRGAEVWAEYLTRWTLWNHVRGLAALAASALFTLARSAMR